MAVIALEEVHSSGNSYLDEDEEDEFAATYDIDSETNIHIDTRMINVCIVQ